MARPSSTILELAGQSALSQFRLDKRLRELRRVDERVTGIEARYAYFVHLAAPLGAEHRQRLDALLLSGCGPAALQPRAQRLFVVPRPGTISPWSSKATDIAHACDLDEVRRIERGICYALTFRAAAADATARLAPLLYDRMTETVLARGEEAIRLFEEHEPAPLGIVRLGDDGRAALSRANEELGLALSGDEIDYLIRNLRAPAAIPTDAELMMFAQANSEHCRHKIFNAEWVIDGEQQPAFRCSA